MQVQSSKWKFLFHQMLQAMEAKSPCSHFRKQQLHAMAKNWHCTFVVNFGKRTITFANIHFEIVNWNLKWMIAHFAKLHLNVHWLQCILLNSMQHWENVIAFKILHWHCVCEFAYLTQMTIFLVHFQNIIFILDHASKNLLLQKSNAF